MDCPRKLCIEYPDVADIKEAGRKTSEGGKDYFKNTASKASTRRYFSRKARSAAKAAIRSDI